MGDASLIQLSKIPIIILIKHSREIMWGCLERVFLMGWAWGWQKLMKHNFFQLNINFYYVCVFFKIVSPTEKKAVLVLTWRACLSYHNCQHKAIRRNMPSTHSLPLPPIESICFYSRGRTQTPARVKTIILTPTQHNTTPQHITNIIPYSIT